MYHYGAFGEGGDWDHEMPEVFVDVEWLEDDLDLLWGEDCPFEGVDVARLEGLSEAVADDILILQSLALFGLQ